jgi:hypothetical protein
MKICLVLVFLLLASCGTISKKVSPQDAAFLVSQKCNALGKVYFNPDSKVFVFVELNREQQKCVAVALRSMDLGA